MLPYTEEEEKYHQYLLSDEWKIKREEIFKKKGEKCIICGERTNLNIHHLNYDTIYCEEINDYYNVIVLCEECHRKMHEIIGIEGKRTIPNKQEEFKYKPYEPPIWEIRQSQYLEYMMLTQDVLLNRDNLLEYLYKKRGWTKKTIDLAGIGFDDTEDCFTIPIFSLKHDCITDFELRQYGEKKIRRIGGGCSTVAKIWGLNKAKTLYIVEGFIDGITLTQWLLEKHQKDFTVYSCSNGVGSLLSCLSEINFSNFDEVKLILDNDEPADKETIKIINKYPFIKDSRQFLKDSGLKDITEFYIKKVKKDTF